MWTQWTVWCSNKSVKSDKIITVYLQFIRTVTSRKPLNRFWWNLNLWSWIYSWELDPWKIRFRSDDVCGLGEHPVCHWHCKVFSFLVSSSRTQVTSVDRFWWSIRHTTSYHERMCLLGILLISQPIYGSKKPHPPKKEGVRRHFQTKRAKY